MFRLPSFVLSLSLVLPGLVQSGEMPEQVGSDTNEHRIHLALSKSAEFDLVDKPLPEVTELLQHTYGVPAAIDELALEAINLDPATPITLQVSGITLRAALAHMLKPIGLTTVLRDDVLEITSVEEAETVLQARVYPVADLVDSRTASGEVVSDFDSLIELIATTVAPEAWDDVGGEGSICEFKPSRALVVSQTQEVHRQVDDLLRSLRSVDDPAARESDRREDKDSDDIAKTPSPDVIYAEEAACSKISEALDRIVSLEEQDMPIRQVAAVLGRKLTIPVLVDEAGLEAVNFDLTTAVRTIAKPASLRSALNRMLRPVGLTYSIRHEALVITTTEEAETNIVTAIYPVRDLVQRSPRDEKYDFDSLIHTLHCTIAPETWDDVGGEGTAQPFAGKGCLVVSQTMGVHEQIQALLPRLRHAKKEQSGPAPAPPNPDEVVRRIYDISTLMVEPQSLEELVVHLVEPDRWAGSVACIKAIPGKLVVRQTRGVQQRIDEFLRELDPHRGMKGAGGGRGMGGMGMGGSF